jgi:hypothetical protein
MPGSSAATSGAHTSTWSRAHKNGLPHHSEGTPAAGGDQVAEDCSLWCTKTLAMVALRRGFPFVGRARHIIAGPVKETTGREGPRRDLGIR